MKARFCQRNNKSDPYELGRGALDSRGIMMCSKNKRFPSYSFKHKRGSNLKQIKEGNQLNTIEGYVGYAGLILIPIDQKLLGLFL
jgi:hypothetical protein